MFDEVCGQSKTVSEGVVNGHHYSGLHADIVLMTRLAAPITFDCSMPESDFKYLIRVSNTCASKGDSAALYTEYTRRLKTRRFQDICFPNHRKDPMSPSLLGER